MKKRSVLSHSLRLAPSLLIMMTILGTTANAAKTVLISDVDDTVKQTHVSSIGHLLVNALFSNRTFGGMSNLYNDLAAQNEGEIHFLSSSPSPLKKKIERMLEKAGFIFTSLTTRKISQLTQDTIAYKLDALTNITTKAVAEQYILVGDNVEHDPEIFVTFKKQHPEMNIDIYIHDVSGVRDYPKDIGYFFSPAEFAASEFVKGRLSANSAVDSATLLFNGGTRTNDIIATFQHCPTSTSEFSIPSDLENLNQEVFKALEESSYLISTMCSARSTR